MITLTRRQKDVIKYLSSIENFITIRNMAEIFQVSERTIRYDLDIIERYLQDLGLDLIRKPNFGVKIKDIDQAKEKILTNLLDFNNRVFSQEERIFLIIVYLMISDYLTIEKLANKLFVSKNTIVADLAEVERILKEYGIFLDKKTFHGISISGDEEVIRNTFSSLYYEGIKKSFVTGELLKKLLSFEEYKVEIIISNMEKRMGISYCDFSREELVIFILYTLNRASRNKHIYYGEEVIARYMDKKEFNELKKIIEDMENLNFLNESDICYITKMFMGAKIMNCMLINDNSSDDNEAMILAKQIIQDAEEYIGVDFSNDFEFIKGLAIHLKVALHRLRNDLIIENPLTEQIKYRIPFIYEITKKLIGKYEKLTDCIFPEDEIAYIAMHIGAAFERNSQNGFMPKAVVVCGGGIATTGILSTRLKIMIPELKIIGPITIDWLGNTLKENEVDFIISTIDLKVEGYDIVKVNPLLDVGDIERIKNLIFKNTYKKQCNYLIKRYERDKENRLFLGEIIHPDFVKLKVKCKDWREAIKLAANPLLNKGIISREYISSMIKIVDSLGPYMVFIPGIAFAHASPEHSVYGEGISLITLKEPIDFGDSHKERVEIIVVFATNDKKSNILTKLVSILEKDDNILKIKNALSYSDIKDLSN
ncbi:BglG family transcription antiterminator [Caloramator sp. CAR-1]|uniref:BglG family transcription antiterminator n=1 Tax=Caloramator sp. CAR-1 TaxID=3062777 RepID=UPI0026E22A8D|nr:BglG family transcription antiterminator [Caloramator sp. CAR-1]MDO6354899.1 BglG family transcription antiterminator [Caloramator sp. CAR-1]